MKDSAEAIRAEEFDRMFDEGVEDIVDNLDLSTARRPGRKPQRTVVHRINVDMPEWMIEGLDAAADRLAVNRQAIIKTWLSERLAEEARA